MRKYTKHCQKGFTLLEILVVLVLMIPVILVVMRVMTQQSTTSSLNTLITTEAQELVALENASQQYVTANSSGWTNGVLQTLSIPTMITGGLLPQGFANRNGATGTSPLFQTYVVYAMLAAVDSKPRIVITLSGDPTNARLARYGLTLSSADLQSFNQQAAEKAQLINNSLYAGVIAAGTQTVTGNYGAFTEDVSALVTTAPTTPTAAVLYGFPDLGPTGVTNNSASAYKACQVYPATGNAVTPYKNPTCPSGWQQVAQFPYCGKFNTAYSPQYAVYGSPVGDIVLAERDDVTTVSLTDSIPCSAGDTSPYYGTCPNNNPPTTYSYYQVNTLYQNIRTYVDIQLNGAVVATDGSCTYHGEVQSRFTPGTTACTSGSGKLPCTYPTANTNGIITNLSPATDILCCLPN